MPATTAQIMVKAQAMIDALGSMSQKEREQWPTGAFGEDYNKTRELALAANPGLADVMPPAVAFGNAGGGMRVCSTRYVEILAYCKQIVDLLAS